MTNVPLTDTLTVNVKELLKFFDDRHGASTGDANGIVAVIGEDLNTAVFQHYAESKDAHVEISSRPVTPGGRYGPQLDRWIHVDWNDGSRILYQTEIKNSSASATDGKKLPVDATRQLVADFMQNEFTKLYDPKLRTLNWHGSAKVLVRMKVPDDFVNQDLTVQPLLILWRAISAQDTACDHLFSIPVTYNFPPKVKWPDTWKENLERTKLNPFDQVSVFSVSSYLRYLLSLDKGQIQLPMPSATRRLQILSNLFPADR